MVSSTNFNMGYNGGYMLLSMPKTKIESGAELSVKSNYHEEEICTNNKNNKQGMTSLMGNLDDIRRADSNHDNIISLNELKTCDNKSEFMEHLIFELEKFEKTWNTANHY